MLIGYARVSKADGSQSLDLQRDALLAASVGEERIYADHASGKTDERPGLETCLKALREGDVLVIWKLDRLGRSLHHLVKTVTGLSERGVGLKVLTGQGAQIDTTTTTGLSLLQIPSDAEIRAFPGDANDVGGLLTILLDGILSGLRSRAIRQLEIIAPRHQLDVLRPNQPSQSLGRPKHQGFCTGWN